MRGYTVSVTDAYLEVVSDDDGVVVDQLYLAEVMLVDASRLIGARWSDMTILEAARALLLDALEDTVLADLWTVPYVAQHPTMWDVGYVTHTTRAAVCDWVVTECGRQLSAPGRGHLIV